MNKYIFFCLLLFASCSKDDESLDPLQPECLGMNMVGTWLITDSVEIIFLDIDSIDHKVYNNSEFILYENGVGNLDIANYNEDYFFRWNLQCEPDMFTISIPFGREDSIFDPTNFYLILPFDIMVNELDYKKMRRESDAEVNQLKQRRITIREIVRK